ncbi:hypothetical protein SEA_DELAGARZA_66 [Microbacterium phage DelaGarza]|nr:hypothetical protein SEA_DELAGARZA_66 [Microbacterium phage DelaGarza]
MTDQHVDGKIVPPLDLQRSLEAAISDVDGVRPHFTQAALQAEAILYSGPMQEWLQENRLTPTEKGETAAEPQEPLQVVCTVTVPLSSPHAAADALSRVPINANVTYEPGKGLLSGLLGVGSLIATWTEER